MREELANYQSSQPCEVCHGARLKPEALAVKIAMQDISYATHLSVVDALAFFTGLPEHLTDQQRAIAQPILKEIVERLGFLNNVGLDYLNLDRTSGTLSGGEPADSPRVADRLGAVGRALRARRAVDRASPARQRHAARDAAAVARPGQHGAGRRA